MSCWLGAVPTQKSDFVDVTLSSVIGGMSTLTQLEGCEAWGTKFLNLLIKVGEGHPSLSEKTSIIFPEWGKKFVLRPGPEHYLNMEEGWGGEYFLGSRSNQRTCFPQVTEGRHVACPLVSLTLHWCYLPLEPCSFALFLCVSGHASTILVLQVQSKIKHGSWPHKTLPCFGIP